MSDKVKYQGEIDELINKYVRRLENDVRKKKKLLNKKETLALLYQENDYPYPKAMKTKDYEEELEKLQLELVKAQYWLQKTGKKVAVVFEGRDAAGKGGTIKRFMLNLNARHAHIAALPRPTDYEKGQWYFQRYVACMPSAGEIVFFDRSWYNRAGVEKVMGYCDDKQYKLFMQQAPIFEKMLVESGVILVKYWLHVNQIEQLRRFRERQTSELRRWKLSETDISSLDKWDAYTEAVSAMFAQTDHKKAPWYVVRTDDKKRGRIACIRHFLSLLDYPDKNEKLVNNLDDAICYAAKANK